MTTEPTNWMKETDDYTLVDKPDWVRVNLSKPGTFYVRGATFSYKVVVKDNKCNVYRRLNTFKEYMGNNK